MKRRWMGPWPPSRWWSPAFAAVPLLVVAAAYILPALDERFPPPVRARAASPTVLAADGTLLRAFTDPDGRWRLPVSASDVDPRLRTMLIAYEDKRFASHRGVDPAAAARALWQAVRHGRIVSGASTLTMQTVRLLTGARDQTLARKALEAVRAAQLERRLSKEDILTLYLNHAPYGGNIEGVRAASLAYFAREPTRLTVAQAALLIALPQAPERRRPDRDRAAAKAARDRVLSRLAAAGVISKRDASEAAGEPVPTRRRDVPMEAPHLARALTAAHPEQTVHLTHINANWQTALQRLARSHVNHVGPKVSAAILVAELSTGRIRAHVGSPGLLLDRRAGHVDMTLAIRSPGSTLKPFIYALGMEAGLIAPKTLMADRPSTFGTYHPGNFDNRYRGLVTAEEALRLSLNVPAVALLDTMGPTRLSVRLSSAGATVALPEGRAPSLAVGLGGFGTRLSDLTALYTALANRGRPVRLHAAGPAPPAAERVLEQRSAEQVADILGAMRPPANARPGLIGYKTGTSYGHRDAWAVGFDARHMIGVWIGRPDGTPVAQLTGWTDAAPLLFDAFARIGIAPRPGPRAHTPTSELPPPLRAFGAAKRLAGLSTTASHIKIAFPPDEAHIALTQPDGTRVPLTVTVEGEVVDTWLVNGRPQDVPRARRTAQLAVPPGRYTITVITAEGASERITVSVD